VTQLVRHDVVRHYKNNDTIETPIAA